MEASTTPTPAPIYATKGFRIWQRGGDFECAECGRHVGMPLTGNYLGRKGWPYVLLYLVHALHAGSFETKSVCGERCADSYAANIGATKVSADVTDAIRTAQIRETTAKRHATR